MLRHLQRNVTGMSRKSRILRRNYCASQNQGIIEEIDGILKLNNWKSILASTEMQNKLNPDVVRSLFTGNQVVCPRKLVSFFQWCQDKFGIDSDLEILSILAVKLCNSDFYGPACKIIERLISKNVAPLEIVYSISCYRMKCSGSNRFNPKIFGLVMDKYREDGELIAAANVFFSHKDYNFVPDSNSCGYLLRDLLNDNKLGVFWKLCDAMREAGISFDVFMYTNMINAHCRAGEVVEAKRVFVEMEQRGCWPNLVTYSVLIAGFCKSGLIDEANELKKSMVGKGFIPDSYVYASLINGYSSAKRYTEVRMALSEVVTRGVKQGEVYMALIDAFAKNGDFDEVFRIKDEMILHGICNDIVLYNKLLHWLCRAGKMEMANELMDELLRTGTKPNVGTYTSLIQGYCLGKSMTRALELLGEMKERKLEPPKAIYHVIVHGLYQSGDFQNAKCILTEMVLKKLKPDITLWRTILAACAEGGLDESEQILEIIKEQGVEPDVFFFNILLMHLCKAKKMEKARNCLDEMLVRGLIPNEYTFGTLIIGFCRMGELQIAQRCFEEMLGCGLKPNLVIYKILVRGHCKYGKLKDAFAVFRSVLALGALPEVEVYHVLRRNLFHCGKKQEAIEIISEFREKDHVF